MVSHEPHDEGFIKFIYTRGMTFPHIFQVSECVTLYTKYIHILHNLRTLRYRVMGDARIVHTIRYVSFFSSKFI